MCESQTLRYLTPFLSCPSLPPSHCFVCAFVLFVFIRCCNRGVFVSYDVCFLPAATHTHTHTTLRLDVGTGHDGRCARSATWRSPSVQPPPSLDQHHHRHRHCYLLSDPPRPAATRPAALASVHGSASSALLTIPPLFLYMGHSIVCTSTGSMPGVYHGTYTRACTPYCVVSFPMAAAVLSVVVVVVVVLRAGMDPAGMAAMYVPLFRMPFCHISAAPFICIGSLQFSTCYGFLAWIEPNMQVFFALPSCA